MGKLPTKRLELAGAAKAGGVAKRPSVAAKMPWLSPRKTVP